MCAFAIGTVNKCNCKFAINSHCSISSSLRHKVNDEELNQKSKKTFFAIFRLHLMEEVNKD